MENIFDELINYWKDTNFNPGNSKEIINKNDKGDTWKFKMELIPQPYFGDLRNSKIFICNINPGYCEEDENLEKKSNKPFLREEFIKQVKQENLPEEYPFIWFNPAYKNASGYKWWRGKYMFKQFTNYVKKQHQNIDEEKMFKWLAKNVAALELVPYHSKTINLNKLPNSAKKMKEFVNKTLIPHVENNEDKVLIINRGYDKWLDEDKIPECDRIFIYARKGRAKPCLNPAAKKMKGGMMIYKYMEDNDVFSEFKIDNGIVK